jgi:dethiobiotin synthetase
MNGVFVTGTDTGIGKTLACGVLLAGLRRLGYAAITQKWVQTGCTEPEDVLAHLALAGINRAEVADLLPDLCPYCLPLPASPHLAAAAVGVELDPSVIIAAYARLNARCAPVLVEGAGGVLVPLAPERLIVDLAAMLRLPALVIAPNRLGTINHTLLTLEALRTRQIPVLGVVMNRLCPQEDPRILQDNPRTIARLGGVEILGELPHGMDPVALPEVAESLAQAVLAQGNIR